MKFTNEHGLPKSLADALQADDYDLKKSPDNVISVTTLISPPKIKVLAKRHWADIVCDVSERIWVLLGQSIHSVLEKASAGEERLSEERWFLDTVDWTVHTNNQKSAGIVADYNWYKKDRFYVSGKLDCYDATTKDLQDYKVTSIWSWLIERKAKGEWIEQLNINALALRLLTFEVKKLSIIAMFRDWSASAEKRGDYNDKTTGTHSLPVPFKVLDIPLWNNDKTKEYILRRVNLFKTAIAQKDDEIPDCSAEERWHKDDTWAVYKTGNKKALKIHMSRESADAHVMELGSGYTIQYRPGEDVRCLSYCDVCGWCSFYKTAYASKPSTGEQE
jgi:hypothetical protein